MIAVRSSQTPVPESYWARAPTEDVLRRLSVTEAGLSAVEPAQRLASVEPQPTRSARRLGPHPTR
jgi:hypothetical protein